mmetsp:Transcript_157/g.357  ORF Transcript_157/g.357 Transcript_157/m.357 type:complete len:243 (-) Transcript_157:2014-2742(-)
MFALASSSYRMSSSSENLDAVRIGVIPHSISMCGTSSPLSRGGGLPVRPRSARGGQKSGKSLSPWNGFVAPHVPVVGSAASADRIRRLLRNWICSGEGGALGPVPSPEALLAASLLADAPSFSFGSEGGDSERVLVGVQLRSSVSLSLDTSLAPGGLTTALSFVNSFSLRESSGVDSLSGFTFSEGLDVEVTSEGSSLESSFFSEVALLASFCDFEDFFFFLSIRELAALLVALTSRPSRRA